MSKIFLQKYTIYGGYIPDGTKYYLKNLYYCRNICILIENELFMKKKNTMKKSNGVDVNGTKIFIENGNVKTVLSEQIQKTGYMDVEESRKITLEAVKMIYAKNGRL